MYDSLLETPTGRFLYERICDPEIIRRMTELSDQELPAVTALTDPLPANLPNRFKRLAGYLVKRVLLLHGYAQVPGRRGRVSAPSLFKRGACYRRISHIHS